MNTYTQKQLKKLIKKNNLVEDSTGEKIVLKSGDKVVAVLESVDIREGTTTWVYTGMVARICSKAAIAYTLASLDSITRPVRVTEAFRAQLKAVLRGEQVDLTAAYNAWASTVLCDNHMELLARIATTYDLAIK